VDTSPRPCLVIDTTSENQKGTIQQTKINEPTQSFYGLTKQTYKIEEIDQISDEYRIRWNSYGDKIEISTNKKIQKPYELHTGDFYVQTSSDEYIKFNVFAHTYNKRDTNKKLYEYITNLTSISTIQNNSNNATVTRFPSMNKDNSKIQVYHSYVTRNLCWVCCIIKFTHEQQERKERLTQLLKENVTTVGIAQYIVHEDFLNSDVENNVVIRQKGGEEIAKLPVYFRHLSESNTVQKIDGTTYLELIRKVDKKKKMEDLGRQGANSRVLKETKDGDCDSCIEQLNNLKNTLESTLMACKEQGQKDKAATLLQSKLRQSQASKEVAELRDQKEQNEAATLLQSRGRMVAAAKKFENLRNQKNQTNGTLVPISKKETNFVWTPESLQTVFQMNVYNNVLHVRFPVEPFKEIQSSLQNEHRLRRLQSSTSEYDNSLVKVNSIFNTNNEFSKEYSIDLSKMKKMLIELILKMRIIRIVSTNAWLIYVQNMMKTIWNEINSITRKSDFIKSGDQKVEIRDTETVLRYSTNVFVGETIKHDAWQRFYVLFIVIISMIRRMFGGHRSKTKKRVRKINTRTKYSRKQTKGLL
jgi:hypothetical protein